MKSTTLLALLPSLALASPAVSLAPRQQRGAVKQLCAQYDYWSNDQYEANNNLWGKGSAQAGGSQCTYIDSASGSNVAWSSTWTWQGGPDNVKSYVYVGRKVTRGRKISQISSMPTAITWKYDSYNNMRANVAYDIFTAANADRDNSGGDYELMIWWVLVSLFCVSMSWLCRCGYARRRRCAQGRDEKRELTLVHPPRLARIGGVYPIGQNSGQVNVGGRQWELWIGYNGAMKVFSFVPPNSGTINSWSGDAKVFFNHLQERQNFPASSQNLIGAFSWSFPLAMTFSRDGQRQKTYTHCRLQYFRSAPRPSRAAMPCSACPRSTPPSTDESWPDQEGGDFGSFGRLRGEAGERRGKGSKEGDRARNPGKEMTDDDVVGPPPSHHAASRSIGRAGLQVFSGFCFPSANPVGVYASGFSCTFFFFPTLGSRASPAFTTSMYIHQIFTLFNHESWYSRSLMIHCRCHAHWKGNGLGGFFPRAKHNVVRRRIPHCQNVTLPIGRSLSIVTTTNPANTSTLEKKHGTRPDSTCRDDVKKPFSNKRPAIPRDHKRTGPRFMPPARRAAVDIERYPRRAILMST